RIARSRDRAPAAPSSVHEDYVIERVDRFEAQNERRVAVLLERDRGEERGFQTVRAPVADDAAKTAKRGAAAGLLIVRKPVQVPLDSQRRAEAREQPTFAGGEERAG